MQNQPPDTRLILAAARLAEAAPNSWSEFINAFAAFAEVHKDNLVKSPREELQINQGRAQILATLIVKLADCRNAADKIQQGAK